MKKQTFMRIFSGLSLFVMIFAACLFFFQQGVFYTEHYDYRMPSVFFWRYGSLVLLFAFYRLLADYPFRQMLCDYPWLLWSARIVFLLAAFFAFRSDFHTWQNVLLAVIQAAVCIVLLLFQKRNALCCILLLLLSLVGLSFAVRSTLLLWRSAPLGSALWPLCAFVMPVLFYAGLVLRSFGQARNSAYRILDLVAYAAAFLAVGWSYLTILLAVSLAMYLPAWLYAWKHSLVSTKKAM